MNQELQDKPLQAYYEAQFDLFASVGWKDLCEDLEALRDQVDHVKGISVDDLKFKQGQLDILELILGRKVMCEKAYEELANETAI